MNLGLEGKSAVVLASTAGLGRAVADALLGEGARVAISGRDTAKLSDAVDELGAHHGDRVWGERLDVSDLGQLSAHLESVRSRWGTVHVLVTNAGGPPSSAAAQTSLEDLDRAYALTLKSAVHAVQVVLPWMRAQKWGRILAMTSSSVRQPIQGLALSNTLRAGLTGFLKTLSFEVASDGVLVNTICTGMFETERLRELFAARARRSGRSLAEERALAEAEIPVGRIGEMREFGAVAAFLVSERASYLNGVALALDGGSSRFLL